MLTSICRLKAMLPLALSIRRGRLGYALLVVVLVSAFAAVEHGAVFATSIWTTDGSCGDISQDVNHYNVGDDVYINGAGWGTDDAFTYVPSHWQCLLAPPRGAPRAHGRFGFDCKSRTYPWRLT